VERELKNVLVVCDTHLAIIVLRIALMRCANNVETLGPGSVQNADPNGPSNRDRDTQGATCACELPLCHRAAYSDSIRALSRETSVNVEYERALKRTEQRSP